MKKSFLLTCVLSSQLLIVEKKPLPDCATIKNELTTVKNSFDNIVYKFKSREDKISLVKTYFSEFTVCGQKGKIKDYGKNVEFSFYFSDADYEGDHNQFRDFYKRIFKSIKEEFGLTHVYKLSKEKSGKSCYFYESNRLITTSKRNIKLVLSYKDPLDETTAYFVSLSFEYYPKR